MHIKKGLFYTHFLFTGKTPDLFIPSDKPNDVQTHIPYLIPAKPRFIGVGSNSRLIP